MKRKFKADKTLQEVVDYFNDIGINEINAIEMHDDGKVTFHWS